MGSIREASVFQHGLQGEPTGSPKQDPAVGERVFSQLSDAGDRGENDCLLDEAFLDSSLRGFGGQ